MKLIFDFDDVVFNAKQFKQEMFWFLEARGYLSVKQLYEQARTSDSPFSLRTFLHELDPSLSFEEVSLLYQEILNSASLCINEEIFSIMKSLGRENCYIVTNGVEEFQMDKIRRSIGEDFVREIFVVSGGKREAIRILCKRHSSEEIIFVDDKLNFLYDLDLEECQNLKTVLFNEHGQENLIAEIKASQKEEGTKIEAKETSRLEESAKEIVGTHFLR